MDEPVPSLMAVLESTMPSACDVVPSSARALYRYNPLVAPIDGMRWCLFGTAPRDFEAQLAVSCLSALLLLVSGYLYFKRTETTFADLI